MCINTTVGEQIIRSRFMRIELSDRNIVLNILVFCVVFFVLCLSSPYVLCVLCCQCLWIVHS
jgi:hypothetical protein